MTRRGPERAAKSLAEEEQQWEAEMAKLDPAEGNRAPKVGSKDIFDHVSAVESAGLGGLWEG